MPAKLSVNINKIALLRNARGANIPDLLQFAKDCEEFGADGITVHPRPDERHVRYDDVFDLKKIVTTEFNIEGYPSDKFIKMVLEVQPDQVTLVPDPPEALTSDEGWDTIKHFDFLSRVVDKFKNKNIRVSLFMGNDEDKITAVKDIGCDRIELYTGPYAAQYDKEKEEAITLYRNSALLASKLGLGVNAGHDLNLYNLKYFSKQIPGLLEVSIGHALVKDCLYYGLENTIQMYKILL
ncbi:MAG: pyridoxine 5'-phosphate synthase [Chitinophagales bacterium]|nr:pyridoxine 5'-phosphate synthase [Chitinophagales bacterium]